MRDIEEKLNELLDMGYEVRFRRVLDADEDGSYYRYEVEAWQDDEKIAANEGVDTLLDNALNEVLGHAPMLGASGTSLGTI